MRIFMKVNNVNLERIRKISICTLLGSIFVFLIGIIFVNKNWWWFLLVILFLCLEILYLYRDEVNQPTKLRQIVHQTSGWAMLSISVFIFISAVFITAYWWFGLTIIFGLATLWISTRGNSITLESKTKRTMMISTLSPLALVISLFCVPSFVANSSKEPANSFDHDPVKIYVLYGGDIDDPTINREHIYAKSWANDANFVNDMHNVFWSNASINSARGNKEFGYRLDQFEPADEWKGDVARALLYMAITYQHREEFDKTKIDIDLMVQWSKMDSPSLEEIEWNHWIKENSIQKNSNQFIDNPWLSGFVV